MPSRYRILLATVLVLAAAAALADDKDLLKRKTAPPNLMLIFGNSQTLTQPILGASSAWDGDGDSPASKMGSAKRVVKQFVSDKHTTINIGVSTFSHNPNVGSIKLFAKHWLYTPLTTDFPSESWQEPAGTIERWGTKGSGPCTSITTPSCTDRSPSYITLGSRATVVGPFFGPGGSGTAYIYLDGKENNARERLEITLTQGKYGDAFTDGTLASYTIGGTHSMVATKQYQVKPGNAWIRNVGRTTPNGDPDTAIVYYVPPTTLPSDLFYRTGGQEGKAIGFLNDPKKDFDVNANCAGWEYQVNSAPLPLIKIPRDYLWGAACDKEPQDSYACVSRYMRPQAALVRYDPLTDTYVTEDPDNPGYSGVGDKYADGCDPTLLGSVDTGLDVAENQIVLTTRNGSQAPIKNLLTDIYKYLTDPAVDNFKNGKRLDDPDAACRTTAVILVYDNFNGCQNDNCTFLTNFILSKFKQIKVPVYVIGFGASATDTASTGVCIAQNSGAVLPDGTPGYFPVTSAEGLYQALQDIASLITEAQKGFVSGTVSSASATGDQMVFFATFNAAANRSVWNGRVNGYRLDASGNLPLGQRTINDPADPFNGVTVPAPSNDPSVLIWNAGQNLQATPGTGATDPSAVLTPGAGTSTGTYLDKSNDTVTTIPTRFYPGRKLVFSLPVGHPDPPTTLPLAPSDTVPELRYDMTASPSASWWPTLKALMGPQTTPPAVLSPELGDDQASDSLRFIWGDRDAVITTTEANQKYLGLKLGDIFHASPVLVGRPSNIAYFTNNLHDYQKFSNTYRQRRRVLALGANDGLFHVLDAGAWDRDRSVCQTQADGTPGHCYDLGAGTELFAYGPRSVLQSYKSLKDTVGPQTKRNEWSVDGPPTAGDAFIDSSHSGTPNPSDRTWHTVLVGGMREGSAFQGLDGVSPQDSLGSYFALDITQPDELVVDGSGNVGPPSAPGTFAAPRCLNADGDASCGKDAADATVRSNQPARAWPTILWELTDVGNRDVAPSPGADYIDMAETWSKPAMGRVKVCTANCGNTTTPLPETVDYYVAIFGGGFDRERLNRRGNWLYMVDVETGRVLYRANSSCGINAGSGGCSPVYFGSVSSEPSALDFNGDGYLDILYVGDFKGQLWRVDLTDLRALASPPGGHFDNQLDVETGSGKPFLFFQAPQPTPPATSPSYQIYLRPTAISLGYTVGRRPALGIAFGTGDRDDITATVDPTSLSYAQRFYYVVDRGNVVTRTEADLLDIPSPTAPNASTTPVNGWFLELLNGERVITDSLAVNGVIFFSTFNPTPAGTSTNPCANGVRCSTVFGAPRFYRVLYATGNPYLGTDRGEAQANAMFLSEPVYFLSRDQQGSILFSTENYMRKENAPGGRRTTIKSWKERSRRP